MFFKNNNVRKHGFATHNPTNIPVHKAKRNPVGGTLSRQELQRIVADIIG